MTAEPQTEPNAANWTVPTNCPLSPTQNPNPMRERAFNYDLAKQVEWLTSALAEVVTKVGELQERTKKPPPKTVTTPKAKTTGKGGETT